MKVIDLLNKIANGEAPKKIKYNTFELKRTMSNNLLRMYVDEEGMFFPEYYSGLTLNDEVEIIEEEKKIPEKLPYYDYSKIMSSNDKLKTIELMLEKHEKRLNDNWKKINEIIDYLKSKGE